jgi:hypothetical protein
LSGVRRLLIAFSVLVACTAPPVTTPSASPSTTARTPSSTTSPSPSPTFSDLKVEAAGEVRGDHALVLHVISSATAGIPSQPRIWDVPLDGSAPRQLVAYTRAPQIATDFDYFSFARQLSPDGRYLVLTDALDVAGNALLVIDLVTGTARTIDVGGGADQPAWSSDGQRIAYRGFTVAGPFQKESGIWVVPASGGVPKQVWTSDLGAGSGAASLYGWTEDGMGIAFSLGSGDVRVVDVITGRLVTVGRATHGIAWRTQRPSVALVFEDVGATPTASLGAPASSLAGHVEVREATSSTPKIVARYGPDDGTFFTTPSWGPKSNDILMPYACGQGVRCRNELAIVDGVTGTRRTLATTTTPRSAAWSSDGAHVLYSDLFALRVVNADSSNDHELFRPPGTVQQFVTAVIAFASH